MTRVAILWHMHQPFYEDLLTGEHILPWVRLHALKDYYGMVALLREFPEVRVTFNLVPSLLVQLEAFAENRARDRTLDLGLKPADQLTADDREFVLAQFFHAQRARMIAPSPRYAELLQRREQAGSPGAAAPLFTEGDFRDLQVWQKLAWIDPEYRRHDPRVRALVERDRGFTEDDKLALREVELELLRRVVPEYREAAARGQIEIATSPFYHPILPLLCDSDVFLRTHPLSRMPRQRFRRPEDASEQLARATAYHEGLFGAAPVGLWPSEGSVSEAIVPLAAHAGFQWMATDELILARTLGTSLARDAHGHLEQPDVLYRPYRVRCGGAEIACLFRDHTLSDLIGFTYAGWHADTAAADFVARLVEGGRRFASRTGGADAVIPVILDGENAWEHFEDGGRPFLRALYARLSAHPELTTVTMRDAASAPTTTVPGLFPGSWINGDFYIWMGHADDHRAWSQLADARQALDAPPAGLAAGALAKAREEILIAEGSDWFWWYGDDHSSDHDLEFDDLFRRHLRNAYRLLSKPVPEELFVSNITTEPPRVVAHPPTGFLQVELDGQVTSYFEWLGAGEVDVSAAAGSMHQVSTTGRPQVTGIRFGFDTGHLYLRVDCTRRAADLAANRAHLRVTFLRPDGIRLVAAAGPDLPAPALQLSRHERDADGQWRDVGRTEARGAAGQVFELAIPFAELDGAGGPAGRQPWGLFIAMYQDEVEVERYPPYGPLEVTPPTGEFAAANWL